MAWDSTMRVIENKSDSEMADIILRGSDPIGGVESGGVERQCRSERVSGAAESRFASGGI